MKGLKDQLREWKKQSNQAKKKKKKKKKKRKEKLSTRDIEDLMGMHRPCYERRRGAIRQK
ncbi:hypothetical protein LHW04_03405 [Bacillus tropicus]|uniref:hypothetical protein n=1 Tax=Bacillus cereus group TaxID=86661 RepID=UPI000984C233|nr:MULTISPECIES: hypothetical protein [Bacillus cereus group]MCB4844109.1 hypothetical protein [Bacillus tropicus]MDA1858964.1 hypothetical protein [Bacillus cereus group sp. BY122LC]OOL14346.1 hypothetical protein BHL37_00160 [Bacillus cereus]PJZ18743.1 hypothetical protein CEW46_26815 [Bacillus cereus]